ncbi:MAG: SpoIIE family protein phosphatase [Ruminococcus sp.]|nr:SpoIIE family protein phosphatase [Ruminococcus sp.]
MGAIICAALFMMSSKIYINDHATMGGSPAEILERVNKLVYANNDAHMFVTVWLGILGIALLVALIVFLSFKLLFLIVNIMYDITYGRDDAERGESGRRVKKSDSDFFFG